ncbi:hypothetical protein M427DRAFT_45097 [Gonapodya prolifera JEL478]|uniref:L domain-like protein n=1 Tax=Gonapodya prolifera (strain JEL478) TaxID=1344416 RepID=A0A139ABL5_GONPJ|nr:hypothetical protein M427DRAFT_45097 [Gonapodya prolifera JEL478]|eukprot:KXS14222.1 hypothetical protein M427DRAFT_45097 [Gonapodya prolifera JEL478]
MFPRLREVLAILFALLAAVPPHVAAQSQAQDCAPFEALYRQAGASIDWTIGACCTNVIFTCAARRVTNVTLININLRGPFPDLSPLTELKGLAFVNVTGWTGPLQVPSGGLQSLVFLQNEGRDALPAFSSITQLRELGIDTFPNWTGPVPDLDPFLNSLAKTSSLEVLTGLFQVMGSKFAIGAPTLSSFTCGAKLANTCRPFLPTNSRECSALNTTRSSTLDSRLPTTSTASVTFTGAPSEVPPTSSPGVSIGPIEGGPRDSSSGTLAGSIGHLSSTTGSGVTLAYRSVDAEDLPRVNLFGSGIAGYGSGDGSLDLRSRHRFGVGSNETAASTRSAASLGGTGERGAEEVLSAGSQAPHWAFVLLVGQAFENFPRVDLPQRMPVFPVINDFLPTNADEVPISYGDAVKLRTVFRDGWSFDVNVNSEESGLYEVVVNDCLRISLDQPTTFGASRALRLELAVGAPTDFGSGSWPVLPEPQMSLGLVPRSVRNAGEPQIVSANVDSSSRPRAGALVTQSPTVSSVWSRDVREPRFSDSS